MVQAIRTVNVQASSLRAGDRIVHNGEITGVVDKAKPVGHRDIVHVQYLTAAGGYFERILLWDDQVMIAERSR